MTDTILLDQIMMIQLANLSAEKKPVHFNPRPPGVIRAGSASDVVFRFLQSSPGMRNEAQIRWATKRSHSAVSWALIYLISIGKVESVPDVARNTRYKRYRAKVEK